jgi:hypothetical protein
VTPRERVLAVLRGGKADRACAPKPASAGEGRVPFTIYSGMIPQCAVERRLRNEGLCLVERRSVVRTERPNCSERIIHYEESGKKRIRVEISTPKGPLSILKEPAGFTSWTIEHIFKGPADYAPLRAFAADVRHYPDYDSFAEAEKALGEDVIVRAGVGAMPLHEIMIHWMGVEAFAVEWADRRDEVLALEKIMASRLREVFPIVASAPITHANFGGNEVPEVMGPVRYEEFCLPLMQECAEAFHGKGRLLGSHMDGNNRPWKHLVAKSGMDYVEAFTPAPSSDMSLAEALEACRIRSCG